MTESYQLKMNSLIMQVIGLIIAGLIFYGITTAKMEVYDDSIKRLDETKADKDAVNQIRIDIREIRKSQEEILKKL